MESVLVIGTDVDERIFIKCFEYTTDSKLEKDVRAYIGKSAFFIIYEEDLDTLEEELENMYTPLPKHKKLSKDDIRTIRLLVESGDFKKKEIAANYGVSRQTIWKVCQDI